MMDESLSPDVAAKFFRTLNARLSNLQFADARPELFVIFQNSNPEVTMYDLTRLTGAVDLASRRAQAILVAMQKGEWTAGTKSKAFLPLPIRPTTAPLQIVDLDHGSAKGVARVGLALALVLDSRSVNVAANIAGLVGVNAIDIVSWAEEVALANNSPTKADATTPTQSEALPPEVIEAYGQLLGADSSLCIAVPSTNGGWYKLRMVTVAGQRHMSAVPIFNDAGEEYVERALSDCDAEMAARANAKPAP